MKSAFVHASHSASLRVQRDGKGGKYIDGPCAVTAWRKQSRFLPLAQNGIACLGLGAKLRISYLFSFVLKFLFSPASLNNNKFHRLV